MTEEERRPLMIHPNPHWGMSNRNIPESSGEYTQITSSAASGVQSDRGFVSPRASLSGSSTIKSKRKKTKGDFNWTLCGASGAILISVILERLAFYGLMGNLVLFLNKSPFFWASYHAMDASFLFFGIAYIMSLFGGWLADSILGRFKTLILTFAIYVCGMLLMPFLAVNSDLSGSKFELPPICASSFSGNTSRIHALDKSGPFEEECAWLVYITLMVIAFGCGAFKANICPFGSDQLARAPQNIQFSFFNWYYWCVNIGSIIALTAVAYVEQQQSFKIGFIVCTASLGCSWLIFLSGRCFYNVRPPDGSVLTNIFQIIRLAWRNKRQRRRERKLNERIAECPNMHEVASTHEGISFLDHAKHKYGGIFHNSLVEDVKKLKIILAVFAVTIPYWLVYFQMQTTFVIQGLHMKLGSGKGQFIDTSNNSTNSSSSGRSNSPILVVAWFSLFDAATVIILLPLFDRVIYPKLAKRGYHFTFAKRIILGMFFALVAMLAAGVVEHYRLKAYWPKPEEPCVAFVIRQEIGFTMYNASDMPVYWQIPQYVLIGVSEVFASVACLQFAVSVSPKSMKAVITGLYYFFMGTGSLLGTAILSTLSASKIWFYKNDYGNINCRLPCKTKYDVTEKCHLDYYFYLLAGLELSALLLFLLIIYMFDLSRVEQLIATNVTEANSGSIQKNKRLLTRSS